MHKNAYSLYKSDNASLVVIIFTFHPSEFSRKATLYLLISSNKEKKEKKVRFFFFSVKFMEEGSFLRKRNLEIFAKNVKFLVHLDFNYLPEDS